MKNLFCLASLVFAMTISFSTASTNVPAAKKTDVTIAAAPGPMPNCPYAPSDTRCKDTDKTN